MAMKKYVEQSLHLYSSPSGAEINNDCS